MSMNIRYPNITSRLEGEQIAQIKSYLHQLVDQLNYILPTISSGDGSTQAASTNSNEELSYYELRSFLLYKIQKLEDVLDSASKYERIDGPEAVKDHKLKKINFYIDENGKLYYEVEEQ